MENRRKIFIRRHAPSKLERRVEMTCDRGIVSFSDKIVQDGETKGKKNFPLLSLPSRSISFLFSSLVSTKYIYF